MEPSNKRMQLPKLRAAPVLQAKVPPCAPAGWMDGVTASQLIPVLGGHREIDGWGAGRSGSRPATTKEASVGAIIVRRTVVGRMGAAVFMLGVAAFLLGFVHPWFFPLAWASLIGGGVLAVFIWRSRSDPLIQRCRTSPLIRKKRSRLSRGRRTDTVTRTTCIRRARPP